MDGGGADEIFDPVRDNKIVNSPAGVVFSGIKTIAPPTVNAGCIRIQKAEGIGKAGSQQFAKTVPFFIGETGTAPVGGRIFQVDFLMGHIQVTAGDDRLFLVELTQVSTEGFVPLQPVIDPGQSLLGIQGLDELRGITLEEDGTLRIGSLTTFSHITNNPLIQKYINVLGEAVDMVGGPQIRNAGTIGGNTCNGAVSADSTATLHAYEAIVELTGPNGIRRLPINEFYIKPGVVDLREGLDRSPFKKFRATPGFSVAIGKWFTPGLGLRTKFSGLWGRRVIDEHKHSNDHWTLNENVLFNLSNMIYGYNETRVWNFVPFVGAGINRSCDYNRYAMNLSAGILNTFRLSKHVGLYFELGWNWAENDFDGDFNDMQEDLHHFQYTGHNDG